MDDETFSQVLGFQILDTGGIAARTRQHSTQNILAVAHLEARTKSSTPQTVTTMMERQVMEIRWR
jgi:hypothetical protein